MFNLLRKHFRLLFISLLSLIIVFQFIIIYNSYKKSYKTDESSSILIKPYNRADYILRAIIIYYPQENEQTFLPELRWLYRSWCEMMKLEPKNWRTDLIIFTNEYSESLKKLKCINKIRKIDFDQPPQCRVIRYISLNKRDENILVRFTNMLSGEIQQVISIPNKNNTSTFKNDKRSEMLFKNLKTYVYIDGINCLFEGYSTFKMYDYVLRTDIDVFLTKEFANYIPIKSSMIVGEGMYGTTYNRLKLYRIARSIDLMSTNISDMSSTWYGSPTMIHLISDLTLDCMLHLAIHEFARAERDNQVGRILWPYWCFDLLSYYGQQMALNHLVATGKLNVTNNRQLLDQSTTSNNTNLALHLHCDFNNNKTKFSKVAFKTGLYDTIDPETLLVTNAQTYAMKIALESKLMTLDQLANSLITIGNNIE
ncbi:unnamed protein product [Didymodactylos carnosus]|uniref:DUF7164 domain-containing protein n=1 Tax=Didymodactylos carnosus TaxID=1234261 RepID=A0A814QS68_9BILA|nr:unnamed protein product [Didymodactylos carnosus]CAF1123602.1 unnamed protein product [Didymodactylos carnosus]CAF3756563.1 unnamed protein product [Didymodactylos carnosus]CAF3887081.1 unnamed protein product [Didymodactylos carnosus]